MEDLIKQINALSKKQKEEGLNEEEKALQKALREQYLANFRKNLTAQVESIVIKNPDGTLTPVKYKKKNK